MIYVELEIEVVTRGYIYRILALNELVQIEIKIFPLRGIYSSVCVSGDDAILQPL